MERMQTRALVEGAIFAGITAVLGIIYYYSSYLGIIGYLWPVPTVIVGYRNGVKASILSAMTAGLAVSLFTQPLAGLGMLIGFGLPGIIMGYMISKKADPYVTILACAAVLAVTTVFQFMISLVISGINLNDFASQYDTMVNSQLPIIIDMYKKFGLAESDIKKMSDSLIQTFQLMKLIIPTLVIGSGLVASFVCYKLSRLVLNRTGYSIANTESFSRWRLQAPYSYILIAVAVIATGASYIKLPYFNSAAINISMILMYVLLFIGLSVVVFFAGIYGERYNIPKPLRFFLVILILLYFSQLIPLLGILDMVLDIRKLGKEKRIGGGR